MIQCCTVNPSSGNVFECVETGFSTVGSNLCILIKIAVRDFKVAQTSFLLLLRWNIRKSVAPGKF